MTIVGSSQPLCDPGNDRSVSHSGAGRRFDTIQPHGVLLALHGPELRVDVVSENAGLLLDVPVADLCGAMLVEYLDPSSLQKLRTLQQSATVANPLAISLGPPGRSARVFEGIVHRRDDARLILELQTGEAAAQIPAELEVPAPVERLQTVADIQTLLATAAADIRAVAGFDRVLVHCFDGVHPDEIVAEAQCTGSTLGSDWDARVLNDAQSLSLPALHLVADTAYTPARLIGSQAEDGSADLELSRAILRGLAPSIRNSLHACGTRALMTISIVIRGRLWGIIACHHAQPRRLSYAKRSACELIGHMLTWQLGARLDSDSERRRRRNAALETHVEAAFATPGAIGPAIVEAGPDLRELFCAQGIAVCLGTTVWREGTVTLSDRQLRSIAAALQRRDAVETVTTSDHIAELVPELYTVPSAPAGVLAARLSSDPGDALLVFRREVLNSASSREPIRGRSQRWTSEDTCAAANVAAQIMARVESTVRRQGERSNDELGERTAHAQALIALSEDVSGALPSRAAVIDAVLTFAMRQTNADGGAFEVLGPDEVMTEAARGILTPLQGSRAPRERSLSGRCVELQSALTCNDAAAERAAAGREWSEAGAGSILVVPLVVSAHENVVLKVVAARTRAFDIEDVHTLKLAANNLQSALRAAREYQAVATAELEHRTYARQLRALHAIASTTTSNRKDQIDAALQLGLEQLGLDWGFLGVIDYATQDFIIESSVSRDGLVVAADGTRMPLGRSIIGRVTLNKDVIVVDDVAQLAERSICDGWKSYIAVPLFIDGVNYGAVGFTSQELRPAPFSQANIEFLAVAGELIASAIERGRQREQLENTRTRYSALIEAIPQMVWVIDATNRLQYVNARWTDYTGMGLEQSRTAGSQNVYDANDLRSVGFDRQPLPSVEFDFEIRLRRFDGVFRWHLVRSVPFRTSGGDVDAWLVTGSDIEERKSAETLLADVHEAALAATEAKSRFLASMSHEIRTPMNGVIGMTELLLLTALSDEQREYIEVVRDSGQSLLRVLNDILDYSKVEAGKLELETVQFDLPGQIESVVELLRPGFTGKRVDLTTQIAPGVPAAAVGDPGRLRQILLNLTGNALKFTASGGSVRIEVAAAPADGAVIPVRFSITDTGIGMPPHVIARLFVPFAQGDESTTRKYGGTGLGLSISAELVALMGGEIGVESVPGAGSTFWFAIPFSCAAGARSTLDAPKRARAQPAPTALRSERILLVEDNEINTFLALKQLRRLGFVVAAVENGRKAVDALERERFDLVLMDCHMPEMDGFEATREIRRLYGTTPPHLPIVAMTADARDEDHQNCLLAGMDDYISKPTNLDSLRAVLDRWLPAPERRRASRSLPPDLAPVIGMPMLLDLFDGNRAAVLDLLAAAERSIQTDLGRIERAVLERDFATVGEAAHRLKGTSGSIRSGRLVEIAAAIESETKGVTPAVSPRLLADLRAAAAAISAEITRQAMASRTSARR